MMRSVTEHPPYDIHEVGDDCGALLSLRREWFPEPDADFDARFRDWWARERHQRHAVVAHVAGTPVGMANGQVFSRMPAPGRPSARWLYAANVYVGEAHRRQGVGRTLVQALVDFAEREGMVRVVLAPSAMSVPLYASLGFRPADDLMRLDLPAGPAPPS